MSLTYTISIYYPHPPPPQVWSSGTVMIRRTDDAVDFDVPYNTFQSAIGVQSGGSYWMGLDAMHGMASPCPASVRMEQLDASGTQHFTYFKECFVGPSSEDYAIRFRSSTTDIPDGASPHCNTISPNLKRFSARDHGPYQSRASQSGWWWAYGGGNALTIPFSSLQCSTSVFPNLVKVELVLLTRDGQVCNY